MATVLLFVQFLVLAVEVCATIYDENLIIKTIELEHRQW